MNKQTDIFTKVGHGPNLIFLHGWKQDRHTWDGVIDHLKNDFTCWTLDLPGFGQNPRPKNTWSPADYAKWVGEFITEHKIKDPIIIGHSFGGRVALFLASNDLKLKIKNLKLVLYATPGFREPLPRFTNMAGALARATKTWLPIHKLPLVKQVRERLQSRDFKEADTMQDIFLAAIEYDLSDAMSKIDSEVLLLWGEDDTEVPLKIGEAMHHAIPHSVLKTMPNAGHFAHLQNPSLFAGIIRSFAKD